MEALIGFVVGVILSLVLVYIYLLYTDDSEEPESFNTEPFKVRPEDKLRKLLNIK
jgi:hypothetical protein